MKPGTIFAGIIALATLLSPIDVRGQYYNYHFYIWIRVSDTRGGLDTLVFGAHANGSYGVDTALGEQLAPPPPPVPGSFYACWMDIGNHTEMDQGLKGLDLRKYFNDSQVDTYHIYTVPGTPTPGPPVIFEWPDSAYLAERCKNLFFENPADSTRINMFRQRSYRTTSRFHKDFFIYRNAVITSIEAGEEHNSNIQPEFSLHQNYPNPFNPTTTISYWLPVESHVTLKIFSVLGQVVAVPVDYHRNAGYHEEVWDTGNLSSGIYVYQIMSVDRRGSVLSARKRMTFVR